MKVGTIVTSVQNEKLFVVYIDDIKKRIKLQRCNDLNWPVSEFKKLKQHYILSFDTAKKYIKEWQE
jgi:hypothetical protein